MCTGLEIALVAGTALSAGGTVMSGMQQRQAANANAELARREADAEKAAAATQAERIRRAGRSQVSQANAALAASGVDLASDTAIRIGEQITRDAESDAYAAIMGGNRNASTRQSEAALSRWQGGNAMTSSLLGAAGTVAQGGSNWIKAKG